MSESAAQPEGGDVVSPRSSPDAAPGGTESGDENPPPSGPTSPSNRDASSEEGPSRNNRTIQHLLTAIVILLGLGVSYFASVVLIPITAGVLISLLFKPMVRRMEHWHIPPFVSALLIVVVLLSLAGAVGASASGSARALIKSVPGSVQRLEHKLRGLSRPMKQVKQASEQVENGASAPNTADKPVEVKVTQPTVPGTVLSTTTATAGGLLVMAVVTFFLLASGDLLLVQLVQAMPDLHNKRRVVEAMHDLESHISSYLMTVTVINVCVGLAVWGMTALLGLPHPIWLGVMATLLNYVPYLGPLVTCVVIFGVSVLAFKTIGHALIPPAIFVAITSVEGNFITPTIVGHRLSLNPLIVFLALVLWGWMWGIAGALLAVPMLICFKIVCDHVDRLHPLSVVLAGELRRPGKPTTAAGVPENHQACRP